MANVIDKQPETEPEETEEETDEEEETEPGDTLVDSWETENALIFELHGLGDHDEIIVIEEEDDEEPGKKKPGADGDDHTVALALSLEDLDEAIDIMKEIRERMVERQNARKKVRPQAKAKS